MRHTTNWVYMTIRSDIVINFYKGQHSVHEVSDRARLNTGIIQQDAARLVLKNNLIAQSEVHKMFTITQTIAQTQLKDAQYLSG